MAYGLPVVASALPANIEIVENGSNGYIVRNDEEWYYSLEKLIIDENLRKKLGQSGRKKLRVIILIKFGVINI
jgi:glycosyltransferase involved in cell wall biosynthesis